MALIDNIHGRNLPPLAVDFFHAFSRFECALKRAGYARARYGYAEADWDKLAAKLGQRFLDKVRASGRVQILVARPPKKQVLVDNTLAWREVGEVRSIQALLHAVCRARHNLFHGGKYRDQVGAQIRYDLVEGAERDNILLEEALAVLELALEEMPEIQHEFW